MSKAEANRADWTGSPEQMAIARRLEEVLKLRGLDMKAASKAADLGDTYIRDVLRRGMTPSAVVLLKICHALDVSPGWVLTGKGLRESVDDDRMRDFLACVHDMEPDMRSVLFVAARALSAKGEMPEG